MNGATADPCANTIKAPNSSSTATIGSSQNFFRSCMNAHISTKNSVMVPPAWLELAAQVRWSSRFPADAVRFGGAIEPAMKLIVAEEAHHEAQRRDHVQKDH